jgi:hypothetical protein
MHGASHGIFGNFLLTSHSVQ